MGELDRDLMQKIKLAREAGDEGDAAPVREKPPLFDVPWGRFEPSDIPYWETTTGWLGEKIAPIASGALQALAPIASYALPAAEKVFTSPLRGLGWVPSAARASVPAWQAAGLAHGVATSMLASRYITEGLEATIGPGALPFQIPSPRRIPAAAEAFVESLRQGGGVTAAVEAAQDVMNAGWGFWFGHEMAVGGEASPLAAMVGRAVTASAPAITRAVGPRLAETLAPIARVVPQAARPAVQRAVSPPLGTVDPLARAVSETVRGFGEALQLPLRVETAIGQAVTKGIGRMAGPVVRPLVSRFRGRKPLEKAVGERNVQDTIEELNRLDVEANAEYRRARQKVVDEGNLASEEIVDPIRATGFKAAIPKIMGKLVRGQELTPDELFVWNRYKQHLADPTVKVQWLRRQQIDIVEEAVEEVPVGGLAPEDVAPDMPGAPVTRAGMQAPTHAQLQDAISAMPEKELNEVIALVADDVFEVIGSGKTGKARPWGTYWKAKYENEGVPQGLRFLGSTSARFGGVPTKAGAEDFARELGVRKNLNAAVTGREETIFHALIRTGKFDVPTPPVTPVAPPTAAPVTPGASLSRLISRIGKRQQGGNTQQLPINVGSRAEAQANIAREAFEPVEGSRVDEAATAYLRASKESEEAISVAGAVAPTDPIEQYSRRITDDYNKYIRGMGPPSKDFPVHPNFVAQTLRNIGWWIRYMADPTRMLQAIDRGVGGDAIQRYVLWVTRRTDRASKHFAASHTILYRKIQDQYGMVDSLVQQLTPGIGPLRDVKHTKMLRSLAGDVLEEISYNDVNVPVGELLSRPGIARWLTKITPQEKERVVGFAQRTRRFFDDLLVKQNQARVARGQDPIPYIENYRPWVAERNIWSKIGFAKQTSAQVAAKKEIPDFVTPKVWFNPRAQLRREGLRDYWKERDLQKLVGDYIETASKDIFYTNIIQNAKAYIKQMRSRKRLGGAAKGVEQWIMESYAGTKPPISKFAISAEETFGRGVRWATRGKLAGDVPVRRAMFAIRKNLTRAVFPLNWLWNMSTQTASTANTLMRYGFVRTFQGLKYIYSTKTRSEVLDNAYSVFVKRLRTGRAVYQDTGVGPMSQLERNPIEKAEDLANYITNTLEDNLTGISTQAARKEAESLGLTGRALWEFASEGGSKTQSMYNLADMPGLLRAPEVGAIAPFQTFAFDMMNNVLEAMPFIPGRARVGAYAGVRLPSGEIARTAISGTVQNRLKALGRWVAGITAFAMVSDVLLGREPWKLGSFLPFYGLLLEGYVAGNPFNKPLPAKYIYDFIRATQAYAKYGNWEKLRTWFIGYHALGGAQINRMMKGIEAVSEGKVTDVRGETLFETEPPEGWMSKPGIWEAWKAITQGPYAVAEGRAYKEEEFKGDWVKTYIGAWPSAVIASLGTWTESEEAKASRAVNGFTMLIDDEWRLEMNYFDLAEHPSVREAVKRRLPPNLGDSVDEYMDADSSERRELESAASFREIRDVLRRESDSGGTLHQLRKDWMEAAPIAWKVAAAQLGKNIPGAGNLADWLRELVEGGGEIPTIDYSNWTLEWQTDGG